MAKVCSTRTATANVLASTIPNCISYDPCYAYELAVIVQRGLERMYVDQDPVYYYVTVMNENYPHPPMPAGAEQGIIKGMYHMRTLGDDPIKRVRLLGSGAILREVEAAADILHQNYDVSVELWSVTSFTELARDAQDVARWNMLHPDEAPRTSYAAQCLQGDTPVIAASDYMKAVPEQLRSCISAAYHTLGTDGFGRSDTREKIASFLRGGSEFHHPRIVVEAGRRASTVQSAGQTGAAGIGYRSRQTQSAVELGRH